MSSWRGVVTTLALCTLAGSGMLAASSPVLAQDISEAERLLFMSDHLGKLKPPQVLRYRYVKSGSLEGSGQGSLEVRAVKRGGTTAYAASLLIDGQTVDLPGIENAKGNPALLMFLERDLKEMKRITGGSTTYYRKRIRLALAEKATIRPATVQYEGKAVTASEIHIAPFVDDPGPFHPKGESAGDQGPKPKRC